MENSLFYTEYTPLIPPWPLDYYNWKRKKAQEFLAWHIEQVPKRAKYILDLISEDTSTPDLALMDDEEKLIHIWKWFLRVAEVEPVSKAELAELAPVLKQFGPSSGLYTTTRLSIRTECLVRDIGMLLAQMLMDKSDVITWTVVFKPKNDLFFHHPVLEWFVMPEYDPPFHAYMEPIHIVGVIGARVLGRGNPAKEVDLWEVFDQWVGRIPK